MIEQRRAKRFELELPLEIVRAGSEKVSETGTTRNISSGGVLFLTARELEVGGPVEYVVTLASGNTGVVNLRCMGKVLRADRLVSEEELQQRGSNFEIAATLERYEFVRDRGAAS